MFRERVEGRTGRATCMGVRLPLCLWDVEEVGDVGLEARCACEHGGVVMSVLAQDAKRASRARLPMCCVRAVECRNKYVIPEETYS